MATRKNNQHEKQLHPLLTKFNKDYLGCYSKTIDASKSHSPKKGKAEWLHPDIVSIQFPDSKYSNETKQIREYLKDNAYKLYSFEIKTSLSFENLKESYFQAVSNSSWAHEGYLVAFNIDDDIEFLNELKRMNNSFGIGIIDLSKKQILLPAHEKEHIDWETFNLLTTINEDFRGFANKITRDIVNLQNNKNIDIVTFDKFYDEIISDAKNAKEYDSIKGILNGKEKNVVDCSSSENNLSSDVKNEIYSSNSEKRTIDNSWTNFKPTSLQINDNIINVESVRDCYKHIVKYLISKYINTNNDAFIDVVFNSEEDVLKSDKNASPFKIYDSFYINLHNSNDGSRRNILKIIKKIGLDINFVLLIKDK